MRVQVDGLPPETDFDFFVIQVPNAAAGSTRVRCARSGPDPGGGPGVQVESLTHPTLNTRHIAWVVCL
jgi:hypothetical protein